MLSKEKNDALTRVGRETPGGQVLRQYWTPAALSEELDGNRPVVPVRLMGEDLVLFRANDGELGLIQRACPHRGVDLCYGRLEDNGLRCPFHGWHFSVDGRCVEQPGEPEDSTAHEQVPVDAYPVIERNGIVFAYLGEGDPPPLPNFDCLRAPETHVFSFKGLWQCNWLQALEVGIDPVHASFLHRFLEDEDSKEHYGRQFRDTVADTEIPITQVLRDYPRPQIVPEKTDYGLRITSLRQLDNGMTHARVTNQIFPCAITIPMSATMNITQWHVPVDDENCYWYSMFTSFAEPVDKATMREQRLKEHTLPDYAPIRNASNAYGYDPDEQRTLTYTGMGLDINVHDQWACESQGAIRDRTREHLATSDKAIGAHRALFNGAIQRMVKGDIDLSQYLSDRPAAELTGPVAVDAVGVSDDPAELWRAADLERRRQCPWDAAL